MQDKSPQANPGKPWESFVCLMCGCCEATIGRGPRLKCAACKEPGNYYTSSDAADALIGRVQAGAMVNKAVKAGALAAPQSFACVDCGKPASLYEHRDYNRPLDVDPVCQSCNILRGPAIPLHGSIKKLVQLGFVPYKAMKHATQLFAILGLRTELLNRLPKKRLDHAAWVSLLPAFDQQQKEAMNTPQSQEIIRPQAELKPVTIAAMVNQAPDLFRTSAAFRAVERLLPALLA